MDKEDQAKLDKQMEKTDTHYTSELFTEYAHYCSTGGEGDFLAYFDKRISLLKEETYQMVNNNKETFAELTKIGANLVKIMKLTVK